MNPNLIVEYITKQQLEPALKNIILKGENYPFSEDKAHWVLQNKRISNDDLCLLLAREDNEVMGFIWLIPDFTNTTMGPSDKVYWIHHWWVKDTYEKTVLGAYLFKEALTLVNNRVILKAYAEKAHDFYNKQPFTALREYTRYTIFFGLGPDMVLAKYPNLKFLKIPIAAAGGIFSVINRTVNMLKAKRRLKHIRISPINKLEGDIWTFVKAHCQNDLIHKDLEYVNWQLATTQSLGPNTAKNEASDSSICSCIVTTSSGTIGFFSFLKTGKEAYLKYFLCSVEHHETMVDAFLTKVLQLKLYHVYTDNGEIIKTIRKRFITFFIYGATKKALAHNSIVHELAEFDVKEQDGHFI